MAEAFGLAASIIGVIGFTLQLWDDTEEIRKGGSTISTADCAKQAAGLQAHCDRVKSLQNVESQLAEAKRIKAIAIETHAVAEELARRLAKCEVPTGQKGWKRYRDVMTVLWHGMRMDADAEMRRLSALRDELQSELLVSMSSKLNLSDVRNSQGFQTLDDDVKTLTEAMLQEQGYLKKAIRNLDVSADERHKQVLTHLRKLIPAAEPVLERDINENRRRIKALVKELSDRLWFDAIPRRHYAITAAHKKTFDWIFNGQKKTTQSNTTLMEWMTVGSGLYWISGRAGTGKSSLMRFLDDDSRTKEAFQAWSGERPLVLTAFYFWNSEAAGDRTLKSLLGLYKGILFGLIQQNEEFAELLFPDHLVIGRDWSESFPSLLDLAQAFERLCTAESLPAAVGLIIDGLDEYDATSSQQMQMAEMLCRAAQSPHLKIIVSSRPEAAFEAVFRESTRLRLHELTDEDRRTYTSDKLKAVTRLGLIATETEQTQLIHLVVERSEGIFLWVNLAVMTLIQEIALSLNISRLENAVRGIPSGNEELSRVFDHMLRNRIPIEARLLGFRLIHTLHYGYSLQQKLIPWVEGPRPKHPITALLYSFFEDDITSALFMPVRALENTEATVRIEMAAEMTRKYSAGLLELRHPEEEDGTFRGLSEPKLRSLRDPEVHFLHKDVGIYLNQPETNKLIQDSLKSLDITLETNLLKCIVMMIKLYNPRGSDAFRTPFWDIWHHTKMIMRIARATEEVDLQNTVAFRDGPFRGSIYM
ncbi:hypothetical protein VSDG_06938 [Cytospora chrysosperma]|uniref:Uncharacterized protein n=1 Tax=Cytospora chrysosperma TaxID=252740 RepID=A0A423VS05_CYTCH|nr:hypothetical protein VSDG_06938 [Valsa sordida]